MQTTVKLQQEEAAKKSRDASRAMAMTDEPDLISPNRDGVFEITQIECYSDCIAIAPMSAPGTSTGGIVLPTVQNKDVGLVLGVPKSLPSNAPHYPSVGQVVAFSSKVPIADITGKIPAYGNTKIMIVRIGNVFALLPPVEFVVK